MSRTLPFLALVLAATACHGPLPEGRYPCTIPADCPPNWFCRADNLCWMTQGDAGVDAAAGDAAQVDAAHVDAAQVDAYALDAGTDAWSVDVGMPIDAYVLDSPTDACAPTAEVCDGHDNDCDGSVDEANPMLGCSITCAAGACTTVVEIGAGSLHNCALLSDGTVMCWGDNRVGQLGDGTQFNRFTPAPVMGLPASRAIALGADHTCAITTTNELYCWGGNAFAQIGDGSHTTRSLPVRISITGIGATTDLMSGTGFTCVLRGPSDVLCWGSNVEGAIGNGSPAVEFPAPTAVIGLSGATELSSDGPQGTCAIVGGGALRCWGDNRQGGLGDGTLMSARSPVSAMSLTAVTQIAMNTYHSCAQRTGGAVYCWGNNDRGEIGDGTLSRRMVPTLLSAISSVTTIATGRVATCASTSDGSLRCWGDNTHGQLAQGPSGPGYSTTPVVVTGLTRVVEIEGGSVSFCARTATAIYCWGDNASGQLGIDPATTAMSTAPVLVHL